MSNKTSRPASRKSQVIIDYLEHMFNLKRPGQDAVWQWLKQQGRLRMQPRGVPPRGHRVGTAQVTPGQPQDNTGGYDGEDYS